MKLVEFYPQPELAESQEELIFPPDQLDFGTVPTQDQIIEPEDKTFSLAYVFVVLLVLIISGAGGMMLWRRRKVDPEHERLKMSSFKSIKVYNSKKEKNISMVDLVL